MSFKNIIYKIEVEDGNEHQVNLKKDDAIKYLKMKMKNEMFKSEPLNVSIQLNEEDKDYGGWNDGPFPLWFSVPIDKAIFLIGSPIFLRSFHPQTPSMCN